MRHEHDGVVFARQVIDAFGDDPQRVDVEARVGFVEDRQLRLEQRHLQDLVALLLAARKAFVDATTQELGAHLEQLHLLAHEVIELERVELVLAAFGLHGVVGQTQELAVADAGDLDRILEREEDAGTCPRFGCQLEQIAAFVQDFADRHLIRGVAGQDFCEGALARTVRPHDRVHLAALHPEVEALEDLGAIDGRVQAAHVQQRRAVLQDHPTLPSSLRPSSLVASTANSIGSWRNTSLQKPLMIIETASSAPMPRCAK